MKHQLLPHTCNRTIHNRRQKILVLWTPGGEERPYKCLEKVYTDKGGQKSNKIYAKGSGRSKPMHVKKCDLIWVIGFLLFLWRL